MGPITHKMAIKAFSKIASIMKINFVFSQSKHTFNQIMIRKYLGIFDKSPQFAQDNLIIS